jgi:hypothetical protein
MPDDYRRYCILPLGAGPAPEQALVVGGLSDVMSYLPQTVAREERERQLVEGEARLAHRADSVRLRAEQVIERERELKQREDACRDIAADVIRRFCDGVLELQHRMDRLEQRKIADALAQVPDADHPEGRSPAEQQADNNEVPSAPLEPPHGDEQEAELAIERERNDQNPGDLPEQLQAGAPAPPGTYFTPDPGQPREGSEPRIPAAVSLNAADDAAPAFVCGRDRRAARKRERAQQRSQTWQR